MRKFGIILCGWMVTVGLWVSPALTQKKSVAEEILDILRADNKISEQQYKDLMNKAKAENEAREAGVEAFRRDSVKDVKKSVDWLDRITLLGDLRVRHEGFFQARGPNGNTRNRERFRLRFGARMKISDELEAGLRFVSGDPNDPISANQSFDNLFVKKPLSIDQIYITVTPGKSFGLDLPWSPLSITAGKFANPLFRPRAIMNSEMIWDDDLTPEGRHETFTLFNATDGLLRRFQVHAMQWVVREAARSADAWVLGGQAVANMLLLPTTRLTLGIGDYFFAKNDLIAKERNTNASLKLTNSVVLNDGTIVPGGFPISPSKKDAKGNLIPIRRFLGGFHILNAAAQLDFDTGYAQWPLALFVDFAHNMDAVGNNDNAIWAGASLGVAKNPGDWAFSVAWGRVETDSVLSMFSYSDYGRDGGTNVQGPIVKIDYMLLPRLTISAKNHFVSYIDRPVGQSNSILNRFQLDAVLAF
ncbi:MAG: putative porin [Deltaproteobacteria bacterium]|nr:putative porin [Deltaproteobacteria bacterium]